MNAGMTRRDFFGLTAGAAGVAAALAMPDVARPVDPTVVEVIENRARVVLHFESPLEIQLFIDSIPELRGDSSAWSEFWRYAKERDYCHNSDCTLTGPLLAATNGGLGFGSAYRSTDGSSSSVGIANDRIVITIGTNGTRSTPGDYMIEFYAALGANAATSRVESAAALGDVMTKFADLNPRAECGIRLHSMSRIEVPPTYGTLESFVVALSGYVRDRAEKAVAALRAEIARLTALTNA
jgi:hypothetical protein